MTDLERRPNPPFDRSMTRFSLPLAVLLSATLLPGQDAVAIKAGTLHTITRGTLKDAVILIENGRIVKIGEDLEPSWNAKVIDASDKVVMPTYVIAHTEGGMNGGNEQMANVPYLTVQDAIDPSSSYFEEALRNGIGTVHVIPGNRTLIGGLGMVVRPHGRTVEDMTVRTKGGMKLSLEGSGSRMAQIRKLRRAFEETAEYLADYNRRKAEFEKEKAAGAIDEKKEWEEEIDPKKKPLIDLLEGKDTAYLYVPSAAEIPEALRIANSHKFETVMVLGPQCYKAAHRLSGLGKPVILEADMEIWETDPETDEETQICPAAELQKRGIPFALSVDTGGGRRGGGSDSARYPWWQMASAIRHGVSRKAAIESMTIIPARILGLDGEVGSIEEGKVANLQILTGDPLAATTWVDTVLLEGAIAYERDKDPRLLHLFGKDKTNPTGTSPR